MVDRLLFYTISEARGATGKEADLPEAGKSDEVRQNLVILDDLAKKVDNLTVEKHEGLQLLSPFQQKVWITMWEK